MTMRLFSGVAVLVFVGVFFALPLYAALTACTMPCCQYHRATQPVVSAEMPGCATECVIRADEMTAAATRSIVPPSRAVMSATPVVTTAALVRPAVVVRVDRDSGPPPADSPLHLLNSVFRI